MKNKQYDLIFYQTSGHGYLKVPIDLIKYLGMENIITPYSYCDENFIYLEEDQDAFVFDKRMRQHKIKFSIKNEYNSFHLIAKSQYHPSKLNKK